MAPDTRTDRHETLRRLHRVSGQLRAVAEHLRQLAEDLDAMVDQGLPSTGGLEPSKAPPGGPSAPPTA
jgi:hypothetical protein